MIWYKIRELEKLLIVGKVSDLLIYKYLLTHLLLFALLNNFPGEDGGANPIWASNVRFIIVLVAVSWGIGKTFEIIRAGDNMDYIKCLISLSLVSSIRTIVVFFILAASMPPAILVADGVNFILIKDNFFGVEVFKIANYIFVVMVYYYILISSFKRINASKIHKRPKAGIQRQYQSALSG